MNTYKVFKQIQFAKSGKVHTHEHTLESGITIRVVSYKSFGGLFHVAIETPLGVFEDRNRDYRAAFITAFDDYVGISTGKFDHIPQSKAD